MTGPIRSEPAPTGVVNAMSVDVEDYYHVSAFEKLVAREQWGEFESRVGRNTDLLLELFDRHGVRATFFVLGWVAERQPALVRRLAAAGHELACHSHGHRLVYDMTPREFREDVRRARAVIEDVSGVPVRGYRAPSFSITRASLWALDILIDEGFLYDASVFPIHHDRYGIPDAPRHVHRIRRAGGAIWEVPGSTVRLGPLNLPVSGGGYFRILPYAWTRWGIARSNAREGRPVVFYLHPWELDPEQPRLEASALSRFRHYTGLRHTRARLSRLLSGFRFAPVADLVRACETAEPAGQPGQLEQARLD